MRPVSVISPLFEAKRSRHCHLSMLCENDGIAVCIFDVQQNVFVAAKYILYAGKVGSYNDLNKYAGRIAAQEFLLRLPYQAVRCICPTQRCTLVPKDWLAPEQFKAQLELNHTLDDLDEMHHCRLREIEAECVFAVPSPLSAKLFEKMGSIVYVHQSVPLIDAAMQYQTQHSRTFMGVCMTAGFVNVALCIASELKFYNTFEAGTPQDLLYFLMLIVRQFGVERGQTDILIIGCMDEGYIEALSGFFDNILRVNLNPRYYSAELQEQMPPVFDLLVLLEECG